MQLQQQRRSVEDVLEVVEDQERVALGQPFAQTQNRRASTRVGQADRFGGERMTNLSPEDVLDGIRDLLQALSIQVVGLSTWPANEDRARFAPTPPSEVAIA